GRIQRANETPSSAWFLWYLRATVRELGLPSGVFDGTYQDALLAAVSNCVILGEDGQLEYHKENAATLRRMSSWVRRTTDVCFALTLGILVAFFVIIVPIAWIFGPAVFIEGNALLLASAVTFSAAFFPALGAAVAGIRETGDFESFGNRSAK